MDIKEFFPIWDKLTKSQQEKLRQSVVERKVERGVLLHNGSADCLGLMLVESGLLRAYMVSEEGREITLYRLFERDICLFSASCMMPDIQFDVMIEAEKETAIWVLPPHVLKNLQEESAPMANYMNQLMASRFSEVMWLVEQIMWKSFDRRLAKFLIEESELEGTDCLYITHEKIANHLGSAREVVTRMLKYFQNEGLVQLNRGTVELLDKKRLENDCL